MSVAGDLNAETGMPLEEELRIGRFGSEEENDNGNRLVGLLSATSFPRKLHTHEQEILLVD